MIKRIAHKLKSRMGATIVFAMAVFVLVSIVSVSMITVPLNAAASGKSQRDNEQIRLALASAAGLLRDSIVDQTLSYAWQWGTDETGDPAQDEPEADTSLSTMLKVTGKKAPTITSDFSGGLAPFLRGLVEEAAQLGKKTVSGDSDEISVDEETPTPTPSPAPAPTEITRTITIELDELENADIAAKLPPVEATLTMDTKYNLTATFTVSTSGGPYTITQYFGVSVITPYRMDETEIVTRKEETTGTEDEAVTTVTETVTYSYEGHWELSWPLENYRVSA